MGVGFPMVPVCRPRGRVQLPRLPLHLNVKDGRGGVRRASQISCLSKRFSLPSLSGRLIPTTSCMVKMAISNHADDIEPSIVFTDMLDWLSYTTFHSGTGQMMLRAKAFFDAYDPSMVQTRTISEKVSDLFALYEDGERRLRVNRDRDLAMYRDAVAKFLDSDNWVVTSTTQESLSLR